MLEILLHIIVLFSKRKPKYSASRKYVSNCALLHFFSGVENKFIFSILPLC